MLLKANYPSFLVVDTCVLMSTVIRNLLLRLARNLEIQLLWSDKIHAEWLRNAPSIWKVEPSVVHSEWMIMQQLFPDSIVAEDPDCRALVKKTDAKDQHVVATALSHRKEYSQTHQTLGALPGTWAVLTWNIKDFNKKELRDLHLGLWTPDSFFNQLIRLNPEVFFAQQNFIQADMEQLEQTEQSIEWVFKRLHLYKTAALWARQKV